MIDIGRLGPWASSVQHGWAGSPQPRERGIDMLVHGSKISEQAMPAQMQHFASLTKKADTTAHGCLLRPRHAASEDS